MLRITNNFDGFLKNVNNKFAKNYRKAASLCYLPRSSSDANFCNKKQCKRCRYMMIYMLYYVNKRF